MPIQHNTLLGVLDGVLQVVQGSACIGAEAVDRKCGMPDAGHCQASLKPQPEWSKLLPGGRGVQGVQKLRSQ